MLIREALEPVGSKTFRKIVDINSDYIGLWSGEYRNIVIGLSAPWSPYSQQMVSDYLSKALKRYDEGVLISKMDLSKKINIEFAENHFIDAIPAVIVLNSHNRIIYDPKTQFNNFLYRKEDITYVHEGKELKGNNVGFRNEDEFFEALDRELK